MSATLAITAAPLNALRIWADNRDILVELPCATGPYILRFPLSEAGLSKALSILRAQTYEFGGAPYLAPPPKLSPATALAQSILKRRGII